MAGRDAASPRDPRRLPEHDRPDRAGPHETVTPWQRGARARAVRPDVTAALESVLVDFAVSRVDALRVDDRATDFETDARTLVQSPTCRTWVAGVVAERRCPARGDAEAALVSVYVGIVCDRFGALTLDWVRDVAGRLRPRLRRAVRTLGVRLGCDELDRTVLEPLAWFFLESVRTLECDPNRLRPQDAPEVVRRPYGWSPTCDALSTSLLLLVSRQTRKGYWSNAFTYSPLGYWLRTCGLVQLASVSDDASDDPDVGDRRRGRARLVAVRRLENALLHERVSADSRGTPRRTPERPGRRLEHAETLRLARDIARTRARVLWMDTLEGANVRKLAVLLTLAGLDEVPDDAHLRNPRKRRLDVLVQTLIDDTPHRDTLARNARRLVDGLSRRLNVPGQTVLSPGYAGTVVSRMRETLFG